MKQYQIFVGFMIACFLCSCQVGGDQSKSDLKTLTNLKQRKKKAADVKEVVSSASKIGSRLPAIDKSMELGKSLDEISGLTYDASANELIAHDDELGILYFIDFEGRKVSRQEKIGNIGDFEGVELVDDKIYLIKSDGKMLEHVVGEKGVRRISTGLNANNNVEGLAYLNGQLLIACKGRAEMESGQQFAGCRAIYSYSLASSKMSNIPFMLINFGMLSSIFSGEIPAAETKRLKAFAPSGIAVHPRTGEIYVLSHKGKLLVVCNEQAEIKKIYFLDKEDHAQPEGICFDEKNRLYIANEGDGGTPVIHRYELN